MNEPLALTLKLVVVFVYGETLEMVPICGRPFSSTNDYECVEDAVKYRLDVWWGCVVDRGLSADVPVDVEDELPKFTWNIPKWESLVVGSPLKNLPDTLEVINLSPAA